MQLPITIGLHRSRLIDVFVALCAALASLGILFFPVSPLLQGGLLLSLWGAAAFAWHQCSLTLSAIRLGRDGHLSILRAGAEEFIAAELLPAATVHPWLTVFRLKSMGDTHPLVLVSDSLSRDDFRRLRVFLRWQADFSDRGDAA